MSSAEVPGPNYNFSHLLDEAFNALNAILNGRYTTNFQRLALKNFVLRYIFQESTLDQLPVQEDDYNILHTMSQNLADGFLRLHARELGWLGVYWGPNGVGVQDGRHPCQVPRAETQLRRELESFVSQLLQMEASVGEWSELYATVLRDAASSATSAASAIVFKLADEVDEVQSEPEDFMRRRRPTKAARRSASLMGRLTEFLNESEGTKASKREKRRQQRAEAKEREQAAAQPVEATDERERLSDDSLDASDGVEGSESGSSCDGEGHQCQICGARFARAEELTDHFEVHEGDLAEPEESGGRPEDDLD